MNLDIYNRISNPQLKKSIEQVFNGLMSVVQVVQGPKNQRVIPKEKPSKYKGEDISYQKYLSKLFQKNKPNLKLLPSSSQRSSYRLCQDIYLMLQISAYPFLSTKIFQQIHQKNVINRSVQSIKSRFYQYLMKIEEKDVIKIIEWIQKKGIEGYIVFAGEKKNFSHVQFEDPKQKKQSLKRPRSDSLQKTHVIDKQLDPEAVQLQRVLLVYSQLCNLPMRFVIQKLDQLSGDLQELDRYLLTKNEIMLWSQSQDSILLNNQPSELLKGYHGLSSYNNRRKYLRI